MTITVKAPNGATIDFPDNTDAGTIDKVMRQHFGGATATPSPSVPAGLARAAASGLTFGFDDEIAGGISALTGGSYAEGSTSYRDAKKKFAAEHPYLSTGAEIAGGLPTMFVPGMGAGRAIQAGRQAATVGQFVGQGAKVGAKYGAVSGVGNADPSADSDTFSSMLQRVLGGATGAAIGTGVGAGVGLATKGASVAASRLLPGLRDGSGAARMLDEGAAGEGAAIRQALKDVSLEARRDSIDPQQLVRNMLPTSNAIGQPQVERIISAHLSGEAPAVIAQRVGAPVSEVGRLVQVFDRDVAPRFANSNLLEVMKTPTRPGQVVAIPNTTDLAHVAATSEGRGRQVAMQATRQRHADMGDEATGLIDRTFRSDNFDDYSRAFKSGTRTEANAAYAGVHRPGMVLELNDPALGNLAQDRLFQRAVNFAARDALQRPGGNAIAAEIRAGRLDARAVDLVQRQLRIAQQGVGDPNSARLAGTMRDRLLAEADRRMPGFWDARGMYRTRMQAEEALDLGRGMGVKKGNSGSEGAQMWDGAATRATGLDTRIERIRTAIGGPNANPGRIPALQQQLTRLENQRGQLDHVLENYRRAFGQSIKDELDQKGIDTFLKGAESRAFQQRVTRILGAAEARPFLENIARMVRQKQTGQDLYGNSATAARQAKRGSLNALMETATGLATLNPQRALRGAGDMVSNNLRERRYDRINTMLSDTDMRQVFNMARFLRDHMARSQLPPGRPVGDAIMRIVDRMPAPVRNHIRNEMGGEVRGQDLLTFLSGLLAERQVASTYRGN